MTDGLRILALLLGEEAEEVLNPRVVRRQQLGAPQVLGRRTLQVPSQIPEAAVRPTCRLLRDALDCLVELLQGEVRQGGVHGARPLMRFGAAHVQNGHADLERLDVFLVARRPRPGQVPPRTRGSTPPRRRDLRRGRQPRRSGNVGIGEEKTWFTSPGERRILDGRRDGFKAAGPGGMSGDTIRPCERFEDVQSPVVPNLSRKSSLHRGQKDQIRPLPIFSLRSPPRGVSIPLAILSRLDGPSAFRFEELRP